MPRCRWRRSTTSPRSRRNGRSSSCPRPSRSRSRSRSRWGFASARLLYLGYLGLLIAGLRPRSNACTDWRRLLDPAARLLAITVAMLILGTVFWPWAGGAPLTRPFQALLGAANYPWNGMVLFNGHEYRAAELPWYYAPWWVLISTPPVVLAGRGASLLVVHEPRGRAGAGLASWFVVRVSRSRRDRHGLDALRWHSSSAVHVSGAGRPGGGRLDWTARASTRPAWVRAGAAPALAVGLASMLTFDIRFHPNQGVYFNALVGGPRGAFARYDMDYWGNCVLQAVEWTAEKARSRVCPSDLGEASAPGSNRLRALQRSLLHVSPAEPPLFPDSAGSRSGGGPAGTGRRSQPLHQVRTPDGAVLCTVTPGPGLR